MLLCVVNHPIQAGDATEVDAIDFDGGRHRVVAANRELGETIRAGARAAIAWIPSKNEWRFVAAEC